MNRVFLGILLLIYIASCFFTVLSTQDYSDNIKSLLFSVGVIVSGVPYILVSKRFQKLTRKLGPDTYHSAHVDKVLWMFVVSSLALVAVTYFLSSGLLFDFLYVAAALVFIYAIFINIRRSVNATLEAQRDLGKTGSVVFVWLQHIYLPVGMFFLPSEADFPQ